jgi:hypothetical protein
VVATLYIFGLKRGIGLDTMSEFFARLHLETQAGCSPSALRQVMQTLEAALLETAEAWEQAGCAGGEMREIIGAVDETFLERMMLVCLDLPFCYDNIGQNDHTPDSPVSIARPPWVRTPLSSARRVPIGYNSPL